MAGTTNVNQSWNGTHWVTKTGNTGPAVTPANFETTPHEDVWAGLQLDADQNNHTQGELGNSAAINTAWDLKESGSAIVWVVAALFAVYFGIKLLKHKRII